MPELCRQLDEHVSNITKNYEVILVNDASPDGAWGAIQSLAKGDSRIKGVDLSRNFGQQAAITAGLSHTTGEWVVVMDCDLQDQPKEIVKLYAKAQEGYEVVFGRRYQRQDSSMKVAGSRLYRLVFDYFTETTSDPAVANFGIYKRKVIDAFLTMRERNRTLGLYSLMFIKIEYRIRQDLGVPVSVVDMFHYSTLSGSFRTGIGYSHHKINTKKN